MPILLVPHRHRQNGPPCTKNPPKTKFGRTPIFVGHRIIRIQHPVRATRSHQSIMLSRLHQRPSEPPIHPRHLVDDACRWLLKPPRCRRRNGTGRPRRHPRRAIPPLQFQNVQQSSRIRGHNSRPQSSTRRRCQEVVLQNRLQAHSGAPQQRLSSQRLLALAILPHGNRLNRTLRGLQDRTCPQK